MRKENRYVGIHNEINGGMTDTAKIIRDAWMFGIIPESETCEGWTAAGLQQLWEKVNTEWQKYGFLVANLPDELRERFVRIQTDALEQARRAGWDPDAELMGDE